jgi:uncharacterized protein
MKRILLSLTLVLALCLSLSATVFADQSALVWDNAQLLSQTTEDELNKTLEEISRRHQAEIRIVTVSETPGGSSDDYVEDLFDSNEFGYGENRDGVLLLLCMDLREFRILSNGFAGDAIANDEIRDIAMTIANNFSELDYPAAFSNFAEKCDYYLNGYLNGYPEESSIDWKVMIPIALVIGFVVGLIVVLILRGQLKSVRRQNLAGNYVRQNSMRLTHSSDLYLYSHVTRTRKETNRNSSGGSRGGGSRSIGGGRF